MPVWVAVAGVISGILTSLLMAKVFDGPDEARKPLATVRAEGFSVRMPGSPERTEDAIPIPLVGPAKDLVGPTTAVMYTSESDDLLFAVGVMQGPTTVAFNRDTGLAGMASAMGGKVRDSAKTRYRGHPAIDATLDDVGEGEMTAFVRLVHAGRRVFLVQALVEGDAAAPPPAYAEILQSLSIGAEARPPAGGDPIVARKIPTDPPSGVAAGLARCRRQAADPAVSDNVRRRVQELCADADGKDLEAVESATLTACLAAAQETGDLERCGFEVISPK